MGGLKSDILVGSVSSWTLFGGAGLLEVPVSRLPGLLLAETLPLAATDGTHAFPIDCSGVDAFSLGAGAEGTASVLSADGCACGTLAGRNVVGTCPVFSDAGEAEGSVLHVVVTVEIAVVMVLVLGTQANNCFLTDEGVRLLVTHSGCEDATTEGIVPEQLEAAKPVDSDCKILPFWLPMRLELLCFGELFVLPGLTGLTGNGPQVFGEFENVPPNWAIGKRG